MRIVCLVENTRQRADLKSEHGLSLYAETGKHKLLFDMGASGAFAENAERLCVNPEEIDTAVLSHGHYDHGGGLRAFLEINRQAPVYMKDSAFAEHYNDKGDFIKNIGLDGELEREARFVRLKGNAKLDEELFLFTDVRERKLWPPMNKSLKEKQEGVCVQDSFSHEQSLVLTSGGKDVLLAGCAHSGIVNILEECRRLRGRYPDAVIGGFHLKKAEAYTEEEAELIRATGAYLKDSGSMFYTCHCTGIAAYEVLKEIMGGRLEYMSTGREICL